MVKYCDYFISEVSYSAKNRISKLKVHENINNSVAQEKTWDKDTVVGFIISKYSFITIYKSSNDSYNLGSKVNAIKTKSGYYLRTDSNEIEEDNLGNLPEFSDKLSYSYN